MATPTDITPGQGPGFPPRLRMAAPRVLVVEDEETIALLIEDMVNELSLETAGVASRLEDAMRLADSDDFDMALLDVHLHGKTVFPFAAALERRAIPFIFATGYGGQSIPAEFSHHIVLAKPFGPLELGRAFRALGGRA